MAATLAAWAFGGGGDLIVFLLRNLFVGDQDLVAGQIGLGACALLASASASLAAAASRSCSAAADGGFGIGYVGFAARDVSGVFRLGNGNVRLLRRHLAAGLRQLRRGLVQAT